MIAEGTPADLIDRLGGHHMVEFQVSGNSNGGVDSSGGRFRESNRFGMTTVWSA